MAARVSERRNRARCHHNVSGIATKGSSHAERSPARDIPEESRMSVTAVLIESRRVVAASEPRTAERATVMMATAKTGFPAVDPANDRSGTTEVNAPGPTFHPMRTRDVMRPVQTNHPRIRATVCSGRDAPTTTR
jgi:hypothetical protein